MNLSIILPTYNESAWLNETTVKINEALAVSGIKNSELIIIDDGSIDDTENVVANIKKSLKINVNYIKQQNSGRFLARKRGVEAAKYDTLLFIDSRVHIHKKSLKYAVDRMKMHPDEKVWNAHVVVEKKNNLLASFWDVVAHIAWRRYFKKPTHVSFGIKDFDYYPKGTTCFLVDKNIFLNAIRSFSTNSVDLKKANDDTLVISNIARQINIHISPEFSCTYHARSTLKKFLSHAYHRGQVFEDGFLRRGNRYFVPLIFFLVLTFSAAVVGLISPKALFLLPLGMVSFAILCALISRLVRVPAISWRDTVVFSVMSVPFAVFYGAGIWKGFLGSISTFAKKQLPKRVYRNIWLIAAIIFYSASAAYYMHPILNSCTTTVDTPGDGTGLIMRNSVSPNNPLWGYTTKINYPVGENLNQPTNYAAPLFYTTYWSSSKVFGSVCGLNMVNFTGFVLSALVGCVFVYWLIRNKWISVLAGFALSFTPYFQTKVGGHPSYGYQFILITLLWLILLNWQKKEYKYIFLLGLNSAVLAYWDPYFVLLGIVLIAGSIIPLTLHSVFTGKARMFLKEILPRFVVAGMLAVLLILPLIFVRLHYANEINSLVKSGRGDLKIDVNQFSNRPVEYLLPSENNPFINKVLGNSYQKINRHNSNQGEYTVGLSLVLLFIVISFFIILIWEKLKGNKNQLKNILRGPPAHTMLAVAGVGILGFVASLPPRYGKFRNLSDLITDYITMWRAYSRFYLLVNIALVILACIALAYFAKNIKSKNFKILAFVFVFLLVFVEYQAYPVNQPRWSYDTSVSHVYKTLRDEDMLDSVAVYPLDENNKLGYLSNYLTLQRVHGKALLNGTLITSNESVIRRGIADIRDPQTVPALRTLGITAVIVNGEQADSNIPGLELIDEDLGPQYFTVKPVRLYKVLPGPTTDYVSAPSAEGIVQNHNFKTSAVEFAVTSSAKIDALPLYGRTSEGGSCFTMRAEKTNPIKIELAEGLNKQVYTISQRPTRLSFVTGDITINVLNGSKDVIILSDFGCQSQ